MLNKKALKATTTLGIATLGVVGGAAVANADTTYTVKSGDTLTSIAQQFNNVTVDQLATDNNIANKNLIYVGQQLSIKDGSDSSAATTTQAAATTNTQAAAATTDTANTASAASTSTDTTNTSSNLSSSEQAAKEWIAMKESSGSYTAQNGNYYGRYQLSLSYLGGDLSAANQEKVADAYVASRYGSWTAAQAFWQANGWY